MIKKYIKYIFSYFWPKSTCKKNYLPILCYHSINNKKSKLIDSIDIDDFESQLKYISTNFNTIQFSEIDNDIFKKSIRPNLCITFDDGYLDNYEIAIPLLIKYKIKATFFVVSNFIDKKINLIDEKKWFFMDWVHLNEINNNNLFEVGIHTVNHKILSTLNDNEVFTEIFDSKLCIENKLNRRIDIFAYPYGNGFHIKKSALHVLKKLNFKLACTTYFNTNHSEFNNLLINRIVINENDNLNQFINKIRGKYNYIFYMLKIKSFLYRLLKKRKTIV